MSNLNNAALEANLQQKLETGLVEDEAVLLNNRRNSRGFTANPLDRNLAGQQGLNQGLLSQGFAGQTAYVQSNQRASLGLLRAEPTVLETIQKEVVIQERIHPIQKEEIQPIIYREREQLDVKQVTQMLHETQIQPTIIQQRELPAERREAIVERGAAIQENIVLATTQRDATLRTQVVHAPIVNEVIRKTIIEEIQPVLERDIIQSTVIQNTQPIYEKIVEAPTVYRETIVTAQERGVIGGDLAALEAQGFNLGVAGQRLSQGYTYTGLNQGLNGANLSSAPLSSAPLANDTFLTSSGLKRRSLVEALPTSYSYLAGQPGLVDSKLAQQEMLAGSAATNSALPAKTVL